MTAPSLDVRIGIAIKTLREDRGLTQTGLAQAVGVSQGWISLIERGQRNKLLSLSTLERIALQLGMERLSDLIRYVENYPSTQDVLKMADEFVTG